ncbi:amino acid ABC transporter substrate-binding protein [Pseudomonas sp. DWRC2-2]|uniref:amino acid ABC transporter substrate-binding protein n=1 Tax=Pseudomonas sp. DWRC2-2 TaxID=2804567 RepID=UPI003CF6F2E4
MKNLVRAMSVAMLCAGFYAGAAHAGPTLDSVKKNGEVRCGVSTGVSGFSFPDKTGKWTGIDADTCRAIAAAVLGDAEKVKWVPLSSQQRFPALQSGEVDVLIQTATWTLTRESELGFLFAPATYYDGQGFMVPKSLGVTSAKNLDGATICVQPGSTSEVNVANYFRTHNITFKPLVIEKMDEIENAYFSGRCDVYTGDTSSLAASMVAKAKNPDDHIILPELISKEPLAPAVRQGDDQWYNIVKWTVFALVDAEERGISSVNVKEKLESKDPDIQQFLGVKPGIGTSLGLSDQWAFNAVKSVGNYGEIFERNLGQDSAFKMRRGVNDLWSRGGMMYAMPIR